MLPQPPNILYRSHMTRLMKHDKRLKSQKRETQSEAEGVRQREQSCLTWPTSNPFYSLWNNRTGAPDTTYRRCLGDLRQLQVIKQRHRLTFTEPPQLLKHDRAPFTCFWTGSGLNVFNSPGHELETLLTQIKDASANSKSADCSFVQSCVTGQPTGSLCDMSSLEKNELLCFEKAWQTR